MSTNANAPTLMDEMLGRATVKSPAMNDICFGRGGYSNRHHGNKAYLELLEQHEVAYVSCTRKYQKLLSVCIIHQLRCKVRKDVLVAEISLQLLLVELFDILYS